MTTELERDAERSSTIAALRRRRAALRQGDARAAACEQFGGGQPASCRADDDDAFVRHVKHFFVLAGPRPRSRIPNPNS